MFLKWLGFFAFTFLSFILFQSTNQPYVKTLAPKNSNTRLIQKIFQTLCEPEI